MTIDVHAHYVPQSLIAAARQRGADIGVRVIDGAATPALEFSYGFKVRPFFPKLVETAGQRTAWLIPNALIGNLSRPGLTSMPMAYHASSASRGMPCLTTRSPAGATTMPAASRLSHQYRCRMRKMLQPSSSELRAWAQWL